jgi:hypothetical protein
MATIKDGGVPGDWVKTKVLRLYNRSGAAVSEGDVCAIDLTGTESEVSTYPTWLADTTPTEGENPFANVTQVDATAPTTTETGIFVAAKEAIADNAIGEWVIQGIAKVNSGVSSAVTAGQRLRATSGSYAVKNSTGAGDHRILGISLEAGATGSTASATWALFDGLNGFGTPGS